MDGLPLDVLQRIFAHTLQLQALDCLPRVCRQFRKALQGPSCVWESLEETTLKHINSAGSSQVCILLTASPSSTPGHPSDVLAVARRW